ncbi:MAG: hypothetical protein H7Z21_17765, partial [Hymenobacter sp.]|nr:hypothetical protein [Hymenobacter sp.]
MHDIAALYDQFRACAAVSTDSRQTQTDTLFFALNGPTFRGADFAPQALAQGARHDGARLPLGAAVGLAPANSTRPTAAQRG